MQDKSVGHVESQAIIRESAKAKANAKAKVVASKKGVSVREKVQKAKRAKVKERVVKRELKCAGCAINLDIRLRIAETCSGTKAPVQKVAVKGSSTKAGTATGTGIPEKAPFALDLSMDILSPGGKVRMHGPRLYQLRRK